MAPNDEPTAEQKLAAGAQDAVRGGAAETVKAAQAAGIDGSYTVQPGDTYESIAEAVYGSKEHAELLHAWNQAGGGVSTDPRLLEPGTVLTIPQAPAGDAEPGAPTAVDTKAGNEDPEAAAAAAAVTGPATAASLSDDELAAELERRRGDQPPV